MDNSHQYNGQANRDPRTQPVQVIRPGTTLDACLEQLAIYTDSLAVSRGRATNVADRLFGPEPESIEVASPGLKAPTPLGSLPRFQDALELLRQQLDGIRLQLDRLENV